MEMLAAVQTIRDTLDGLEKNILCLLARPVSRHALRAAAALGPMETQILDLLVDGEPYKEIARRLDLSLSTVRNSASAISVKLGLPGPGEGGRRTVNSRALAAHWAAIRAAAAGMEANGGPDRIGMPGL
ncbi:LuxR C-terminal-related transcriptional regulator [Azospirillum sp. B4]|uniref:LuxR C-terminal-related transcriptional regulator n=1 Tax=Azospirillum sp. B4 TaxID=95605 RepID=UPI0005CA6BD3|nr:LuxR C-terminal-related transcriptional regulator [Azospirillum sp. B4]